GALLEIYGPSGGYDLLIDGKLVEHGEIPWHLDPERVDPVQIQDWACNETFAVPEEAVEALEVFLGGGGSPPWDWARVLYEDGLIDADFGLTPRGARRLGTETERPEPVVEHERVNFCVIVTDSARARVYTLEGVSSRTEPSLKPLELAADLSDQRRRARDAERFSESRPGMRREGPHGPRHTVSDLREEHRRETTKQFATYVLDEAARVWNGFDSCRIILCANPQMLGILRPLIAHKLGPSSPYHVHEFQRELTPLDTRRLREALAQAGLVPARGRPAPVTPLAIIQPKEKPAREGSS